MDGLNSAADVTFLLTTNRADLVILGRCRSDPRDEVIVGTVIGLRMTVRSRHADQRSERTLRVPRPVGLVHLASLPATWAVHWAGKRTLSLSHCQRSRWDG